MTLKIKCPCGRVHMFLTLREVAELRDVPLNTVKKWPTRATPLPVQKSNGIILVTLEDARHYEPEQPGNPEWKRSPQ